MKKYIGMFIIAGLCGSAAAAVVTTGTFTASASEGSTSDLFQNAIVTDGTLTNTQFPLFDIRDIFTSGSPFGNGGVQEDVVFADTNGTTSFVEFNLPVATVLASIDVVLQSDGLAGPTAFERSLDQVRIYASTSSGTVLANLVADIAVDPDYETSYGGIRVTLTIDFPVAITAQYFRAEFDQPAFMAPRVYEIDAFAAPFIFTGSTTILPEPGIGDAADDFQNAIVTAHADLHPAVVDDVIEDLFTAWSAINTEASVFFADEPATAFVDFNLSASAGVTNMVITLENEDPNRALDEIKIYAGDSPEVVPYNQVAGFAVDPDYVTAYGGSRISVSVDFPAAVTAQYFRVEFGRVGGVTGPRIMEIDGYGPLIFDSTGTGAAAVGIGSPWDDLQLATVTASTPLHSALGDSMTTNDLFTAGSPILSDDQMFFVDGLTGAFVDFNSLGAISLTNLVVTLQNEGSETFGRSVNKITVYASTLPGDVLTKPVASVVVNPDYESYPGESTRIAMSIDFPTAINAQYFRVELGNNTLAGCRIWEIDGWGAPYVIEGVPATIISLAPVSSTVLKMVVDAPSAADHYFPQARTDLISGSPAAVAHSDTSSGPFSVTNLSHSASEGDNKVIYVESDSASKFYSVEYNN